ncbi:GspE/PulE family protein [Patescibacteria group bacterium]
MSILDVLAQKKIIGEDEVSRLEKEAQESDGNYDTVLLKRGLNMKDILVSKGEYFNLPIREIGGKKVPSDILKLVPEKSSVYYKFAPLSIVDNFLEIGIVDPDNLEARDAIQFIASKVNLPYKLFVISNQDYSFIMEGYRGLRGEVSEALTELEGELSEQEEEISKEISGLDKTDIESEAKIIEKAPVTKIVATILRYAVEGKASDVHIEHMGEKIRVRFRVDGVLHVSLILPTKVHSAVVARIKILSNMKLDEKRKPQDGRFSAHIEGHKVDFRVSTFPAFYGEKVVMRILEPEKGVKKIEETGLKESDLKLVKEAINKPYGLILISGPTGSGKTTTLYSLLGELDREKRNVLSLEDPVEVNIAGVSQSQVKPEIGYTFASGLRTTLRQDPDIIMVGEIRDAETASLAIQAALTGHLVLSTIHTNDAVGVVPRLIEMGIDPYLIAPTLILAMAQRLIKTLCPGAGKPMIIEGSVKMMIEKELSGLSEESRSKIQIPNEILKLAPSEGCPNGTRGRTGVFEVISMNRELEQIILKNPVNTEIEKIARKQGMMTMRENALLKAFDKIIPFEEVGKL